MRQLTSTFCVQSGLLVLHDLFEIVGSGLNISRKCVLEDTRRLYYHGNSVKFKLFFLLSLSALGTLASAAELQISADAHVNSSFPALNFGNSPFLQVGGTGRAFVRFDT